VTRLGLLVALAACGTDTASPTCGVPGAANVSARATAADVQPILARSCAVGGCHLGVAAAGGLAIDIASPAWRDTLVGVPATETAMELVAPGDPDRSWVVHKIYSALCSCATCGGAMPLGGTLTDAERATIVAWIKAGAE
jgi:hypothetical protein